MFGAVWCSKRLLLQAKHLTTMIPGKDFRAVFWSDALVRIKEFPLACSTRVFHGWLSGCGWQALSHGAGVWGLSACTPPWDDVEGKSSTRVRLTPHQYATCQFKLNVHTGLGGFALIQRTEENRGSTVYFLVCPLIGSASLRKRNANTEYLFCLSWG